MEEAEVWTTVRVVRKKKTRRWGNASLACLSFLPLYRTHYPPQAIQLRASELIPEDVQDGRELLRALARLTC